MLRADSSGIKAAIAFDSDDSPRPCLAGHPDVYPDESPETSWHDEYDPEADMEPTDEPWQAWELMAKALERGERALAGRYARRIHEWIYSGTDVSVLDLLHPIDRGHPRARRYGLVRLHELAVVLQREGVAA